MTTKRKGTILGVAIAVALSMLLGASGLEIPVIGDANAGERLYRIERRQAIDSVLIHEMKDDIKYIRGRVDLITQ